jgi:hypothetical protein
MKKAAAMQTSNTATGSSYNTQNHYECWIYTAFQTELHVSGFYVSSGISKQNTMFDNMDPIPLAG